MKGLTNRIANYFSLVKFSHTIFAMPFAILGFFIAINEDDFTFSIKIFLLVILCMIFARNAAMAFNRYADKKFDRLNERTSIREIPAGIISPSGALTFVIINAILFIITSGFINILTLSLSPVALLVILGYSYTKRFTPLSHLVLGLGLSLAPVGAYIAVTGEFSLVPVLYGLVVLTWVGGFDIIYSLQDINFDRDNRLFSIPATTGAKMAAFISLILHLISIALVIIIGLITDGSLVYYIGSLFFGGLLILEHLIVKPDDLKNINMAFATLNSLAGVIFVAFALADIYVG